MGKSTNRISTNSRRRQPIPSLMRYEIILFRIILLKYIFPVTKTLVERNNRYIGLAREGMLYSSLPFISCFHFKGVVCVTWPLSNDATNYDFSVNYWPKQFQGIYLVLALQV